MWIKFGLPVLKCYYQPAGPLISPHVLPQVAPQSQQPPPPSAITTSSSGSDKKSIIPIPLDSDPEQQLQLSSQQPPSDRAESTDSDVLITGGDLTTFRHSSTTTTSGGSSTQQQPPTHQLQQHHHEPPHHPSVGGVTASSAVAQNSPYSRSMHQMHYPPAYPHNYYSPYPGDAMCYSPPYQSYFPTKVYQSNPAYRRFPSYYSPGHPPPGELYETQPPPPQQSSGPHPPPQSQAQPQTTQASVVTPGHHTLEHAARHLDHARHSREHLEHAARHSRAHTDHLEHYPGPPPGYYTGYSPSGAQCYSRAYMEYPPPCPCPMQQSCPKNAHTGPLIGSNSSNTVSNNSSLNNNTITNSQSSSSPPQILSNTTIIASLANSKTSSNITSNSITVTNNSNSIENSNNSSNISNNNNNQEQQLNTVRGPVKNVNFENNFEKCHKHMIPHCKLEIEIPVKTEYPPDITGMDSSKDSQYEENVVKPPTPNGISTSDSPTPPQSSFKLIELNSNKNGAGSITSSPTKKRPVIPISANTTTPVVGNTDITPTPTDGVNNLIGRKARIGKTMAREMIHGCAGGGGSTIVVNTLTPTIIAAQDLTKPSQDMKNEIKQEDDIKKEIIEEDDVVIVEEDVEKKEEQSIKVEMETVDITTPPLEITTTTDLSQDSSDVEITSYSPPQSAKRIGILGGGGKNGCKKSPTNGYKSLIKQTEPKSYLCLSRKYDKKDRFGHISRSRNQTVRRRKLVLTDQQKKRLKVRRRKRKALEKFENQAKEMDSTSALDETIDLVARGYFSESEISTSFCRRLKKSKMNEARSKSESKKTTVSSEGARKLVTDEKQKTLTDKSKDDSSDMDVETSMYHHNNNNCLETNNNVGKPLSNNYVDDFKFVAPSIPPYRQSSTKRGRSKSKLGMRKRSKRNHFINAEVNEIIIPRRLDVVPRWNNGWTWEGQPFQRKVFLNSDESYVTRTCYPAMRHSEGDVIRPRDCVLLRAGAKKNELPYVAKVAFLWENPSDGEMMMSLLWYYRPEHTDQGRLPIDAADEVFASKHKDHNSVACIEDKCYVLTYSEYCRYRRRVRAMEEDVEDVPSTVVPNRRIQLIKPHHRVPPNTNPELVMFCHRVYEFRLKRLLKMPNT